VATELRHRVHDIVQCASVHALGATGAAEVAEAWRTWPTCLEPVKFARGKTC
jgi:hypothetical protein